MKFLNCTSVLICLSLVLTSCSSIDEIKIPPSDYSNDNPLTYNPSVISASINLPLQDIEQMANELARSGYSDEASGEFQKKYKVKTKNPVYDPKKWIKTKNPLYNKKKWLKACAFGGCIKTKNPAYNPKKWLTTKNPSYSPNKWIYADAVTIDVGYNWAYKVETFGNRKIGFTSLKDNVLRLTLPIELTGSVGFKGAGAKTLSLTKKNLRAGIELYVDTKIDFTSEWCPVLSFDYSHTWLKTPALEIAGGLWLSLETPLDIANYLNKSQIKEAITEAINCDEIRKTLNTAVRPASILLTRDREALPDVLNDVGDYYFNAALKSLETTGLTLDDGTLSLGLTASINTYISDKEVSSDEYQLPPLKFIDKPPINYLSVTLPAIVPFKDIEKLINHDSVLTMINEEVADEIAKVNDFEFYSSGDKLTIKVNVTIKSKENKFLSFLSRFPVLGTLFDTKGDVFLTSTPVIKDNTLKLENVAFGLNVNNEIYPILGVLFKNTIVNVIEDKIKFDFNNYFDKAEAFIPKLVAEKLKGMKGISLTLTDTIIKPSEKIIINNDDLTVILGLMTGFETNIKLKEL